MGNKPSWDDIPSLELSLEDGNDTSAKDIDHRNAIRMVSQDLLEMLTDKAKLISVQVFTRKGLLEKKGILQNINQGGMCFLMAAHGMQKNDSIQIGTMLGRRPFKTNAIVRWGTNDQVGVEYVTPKPEDVSFLSELYGAKILNHVKNL